MDGELYPTFSVVSFFFEKYVSEKEIVIPFSSIKRKRSVAPSCEQPIHLKCMVMRICTACFYFYTNSTKEMISIKECSFFLFETLFVTNKIISDVYISKLIWWITTHKRFVITINQLRRRKEVRFSVDPKFIDTKTKYNKIWT